MRIEPMTGAHADAVLEIYRAGIDEGNATFETRVPSWPGFSAARLPAHRFVALGRPRLTRWP
jgi:L-amino acid N-acyltransferase YncA